MRGSRRWLVAGLLTCVAIVAATAVVALSVPGPRVSGVPVAAPVMTTVSPAGPAEGSSEEHKVVRARDGESEITVPEAWSTAPKGARNQFELMDTSDVEINGLRGVRFTTLVTVEGEYLKVWHTALDGTKAYYLLTAWTEVNRQNAHERVLTEVVDSFRETGGPG